MKRFLILLAGLLTMGVLTLAQTSLSRQDSLLLLSAANDTSQLRKITIQRHGELIAARAQNLIAKYFYSRHLSKDAEREYMITHREYPATIEAAEAAGRLGSLAFWSDRWNQAIPFLKEYLSIKPKGKDAQWASYSLVRSLFYINDSSFLNIARLYSSSSHDSTASKDALIQYDIVRYLGNNNRYSEAISEAQKLIQQYPKCQYINLTEMRIAKYYLETGNTNAAIDQCNTILAKYPLNTNESANAQYLMGSIYAAKGDYVRARSEYSKIAQNDPVITDFVNAAEYGIAHLDLQVGNSQNDPSMVQKAFNELTSFVQNHPQDRNVPLASMDLSSLYMSKGRFANAATAYSTIINFNPAFIDTSRYASHTDEMKAFFELVKQAHLAKAGLLHSQMHDPTNALVEYDAVLQTDPQLPDARINKALCLIDLSRIAEAKIILAQLVDEHTKMSEVAQRILDSL